MTHEKILNAIYLMIGKIEVQMERDREIRQQTLFEVNQTLHSLKQIAKYMREIEEYQHVSFFDEYCKKTRSEDTE